MGFLRPIVCLAAAVCLPLAGQPGDWTKAAEIAPTSGKDSKLAEKLSKEAEKAERQGKVIEAYLLYARAAAADPQNPLYWTKAGSLRAPAEVLSQQKLPALGQKALLPPPENFGSLTREQLDDIDRMVEPPRLKPVAGTRDFHLRGEAKTLFEELAAAYGYTVIFDKDYAPQGTFRFDISGVDYRGALHALETSTNSFIVPLSNKVMLVALDNTQKRQDLEANEALGVPIPSRTSPQEAQEMMTMVQQTLEIRRVAMDPVKRLIYMRDRASKIELARALLTELSGGKPQVSVEVELLSTGRNSSLNFGISLPTQFPLVNFGSVLHSTPSIPAGFMRFLTFGGGASFLGIGLTDAALFATASRADASSLLRTEMTASDGQPATLHIGDKYPIQTGAYLGSGGLSAGGTTYAVISTASYPDIVQTAVSNTGKMNLIVNSKTIPVTIPAIANNVNGLQNILNSLGAGIAAQVIERGTNKKPYSLLVVGSTLGITNIQLVDDPDGMSIQLLKPPDHESSISRLEYSDGTTAKVSATNDLSLVVGTTATPLILADVTNNLEGLRDAINKSSAGVIASILNNGSETNPFYLQLVGTQPNAGAIQVYDDPNGANAPLFSSTDERNLSTVSGNKVSGGSASLGQVYTPPPTFNFEDLGLVLKITPYVHDLEEVTLEVEAEFKVLGSGSYNGVPVISTRKYQGKIRLRTSEWAVVAGLVSESEAKSLTGLAGITQLPVLGPLLGNNNRSKDESRVLLVIKPHVTSMPPSEFATKTYWFGSETKPLTIF